MRIAIGADHAGFVLKQHLVGVLQALGHDVDDRGTHSEASVDYPEVCAVVGREVVAGRADRGIVLGGSGQGEQIAANKVRGVRAALCNDLYTARLSREHNDANVLSMGGRIVAPGLADEIVKLWLDTRFRRRPASAPARSDCGLEAQLTDMTAPTEARPPSPTWTECHKTTETPSRWRALAQTDPEIQQVLQDERHRQNTGLELIASENFVSQAVMEAQGSVLTNKYAEGYPGKRYYGGCEFVDVAETLAIARAKELFGAEHANVQPHSGAQANMAVYFTLLKPGDTVLGMNLAHGGHLTHGHPLNFSGKLYTIVPYGVRKDDERIDYEELEKLAHEHKPNMIMVGASAYPRVIDFERIGAVGRAVGAPVVTDMAHIAGLVAAKIHPSPVPHSDFVTTTTHKTLRGPRGGMVLCRSQYAKDLDRTVFPGIQGGPLMHVIAGKAVCFKEALEPSFADLPGADRREREAAGGESLDRRVPPGQRRHRQSPDARGRLLEGTDRQSRRGGARESRHHGQQERDPVRPEPADGGERDPHRHAGGHQPRHARAGNGRHGGSHRARARVPGR